MNTRVEHDVDQGIGGGTDGGGARHATTDGWQRLHVRMIWVDLVQTLLSLTPAILAVTVFGVETNMGSMWPVVTVAVLGVWGALTDAARWVFTRYRVTPEYVERRTGILVRRYRSVRRDRIRSIDSTAKLRHRLAGLRVVKIGAGQQTAANESAFSLDAVAKADFEALRQELLWGGGQAAPAGAAAAVVVDDAGAGDAAGAGDDAAAGHAAAAGNAAAGTGNAAAGIRDEDVAPADTAEHVLARLRPGWVIYNMFNIWAYLLASGVLWGAYWLATTFGLNPRDFVEGLADWEALGWGWTIAVGVVVTGAVGVVGLAIVFFTENWNFELARVPGEKGTLLRTRQGLFQTREVSRDDNRMRGIQISEPVLWRWMGMADTNLISTGLSVMSMTPSTTILPRGPISVARPVAAAVLEVDPSPFTATLVRHPRTALRRRLVWATATVAVIVALLIWPAATGAVPWWPVLVALALWPVALWAAWVAYRALGHALSGDYLVVRSGLVSRATSVLERKAVSTIVIRESVLQRRLGLKTVSAMTAAGYGAYAVPDVDAAEAVAFAVDAAPGLLAPFVVRD